MNLAIIDVVFCLLILAFAVNGAAKGFVAELFGKAAFLVGLLVGILFCNGLARILWQWIPVAFFAQIVAFLLLFIATFLVIKIVQHLLGGLFRGDILGSLNRALGLLLGLAEGALVVAAALFALHAQPWVEVGPLLQGSLFDQLFTGPVSRSVEFIWQGADADV